MTTAGPAVLLGGTYPPHKFSGVGVEWRHIKIFERAGESDSYRRWRKYMIYDE